MRNPFRLRLSEKIASEEQFLRLFGPGMLDLMRQEYLAIHVHIQSAAGGGKTSLLRLFQPASLRTLHRDRGVEDCKDLYSRMRELGALAEDGPDVLGIFLDCAESYATLAELRVEDTDAATLFTTLLDARIILATLRAAQAFHDLTSPDDLDRLTFVGRPVSLLLGDVKGPVTGRQLFEWAGGVERDVADAMDSLLPVQPGRIKLHRDLIGPSLLGPAELLFDGKPVASQVLLLLDNVHHLTAAQRDLVVRHVMTLRVPSFAVWIAERFDALSTDEMLAPGAIEGRDYHRLVMLESFWRERGKDKGFEKLLANIAERRVQSASDDIAGFAELLPRGVQDSDSRVAAEDARATVRSRVLETYGGDLTYTPLLAAREAVTGPAYDVALEWRALEVVLARLRARGQQRLIPVDPREVEESDSQVRAAAELFLATEFDFPYYAGFDRMADLASSNIQQFLGLAGDAYELIAAAKLLHPSRSPALSPRRQHEITVRAATQLWNEIPRRVHKGDQVRVLLQAIGRFSNWVTYQPRASYAPGVTGIAISLADRDKLADRDSAIRDPGYAELAELISTALKHNLLEADPYKRAKDQNWLTLHLNRLLCAYFDLPLTYGGWREQRLSTLVHWSIKGFQKPRDDPQLLEA